MGSRIGRGCCLGAACAACCGGGIEDAGMGEGDWADVVISDAEIDQAVGGLGLMLELHAATG